MLHFDELLVRQAHKKELEKIKKLLTKDDRGANINKLSLRDTAEDSKRTLITEQ